MPKSLVTGASGFIGSYLTEYLLGQGHSVRCLLRSSSNTRWLAGLPVQTCYGDINDSASLHEAVSGVDYIYHVAGLTKASSENECFKGNFDGTRHLFNAAELYNPGLKRFVFISSQAAAGPSPSEHPIDELHTPRPLTWYGKSKLAAETYLKNKQSIPFTIIRPTTVYGPRDGDVLNFFRIVKYSIIPNLSGIAHFLSLVFVKDLVKGIFEAANSFNAIGKTYFICNEQYCTWDELAGVILSVYGKKGLRVPVPGFVLDSMVFINELYSRIAQKPTILNRQKKIELEQLYWTCSPKAARDDLGFIAGTSVEEGFRQTIQWYRDHKWL